MSDHGDSTARAYQPTTSVDEMDREVMPSEFRAFRTETRVALGVIADALARIEKHLERGALLQEDANARIDRLEIDSLAVRRQIAALEENATKRRKGKK